MFNILEAEDPNGRTGTGKLLHLPVELRRKTAGASSHWGKEDVRDTVEPAQALDHPPKRMTSLTINNILGGLVQI